MGITHTTVATGTDAGTGDIHKAEWNAAHIVELDYVEFTSAVSPNATTEATANTVVTGSSVAYDGSTVVLIEFFTVKARPAVTTAALIDFWLYDGSSSIGAIGELQTTAAQNYGVPLLLQRRLTPSNASHTYSIRASVSTGTGSVLAGPGGNGQYSPGFIRITKV